MNHYPITSISDWQTRVNEGGLNQTGFCIDPSKFDSDFTCCLRGADLAYDLCLTLDPDSNTTKQVIL